MRSLRYILSILVFLLAIGAPVLSIILALQSAQPPVQVGRGGEQVAQALPRVADQREVAGHAAIVFRSPR